MNNLSRKRDSGLYSLRNILNEGSQGAAKKQQGPTRLLARNLFGKERTTPSMPITKPSLKRPGLSNMAINAPEEGRPSPVKKTVKDWGGGKFMGKMTTDQFVTLAGALSHAIAPDTPQGRIGKVMSGVGASSVEKRRLASEKKEKREHEKPERELRERLSMAQVLKAERPEKPTEFPSYFESQIKQINPATGKVFTGAEVVAKYKKLGKTAAREIKKYNISTSDKGEVTIFENGKVITTTKAGIGKTKKISAKDAGISPAEKWKRAKDIKAAKQNMLDPALIEDPRIQTEIDFVNEYGGEPYFYQRTEGTPGEEGGLFGRGSIEATPAAIEKIDISTPEKIRDSDLPYETKLKLLQTRFGAK